MALMVLTGDEELEAYESRLLDMMEPLDPDDERRSDDLKLEKERLWKRVVRIFASELCCWVEVREDVLIDRVLDGCMGLDPDVSVGMIESGFFLGGLVRIVKEVRSYDCSIPREY